MTSATAARDLKLPTAPFVSSVMQIEPQWIDYNGHLNMAYYTGMPYAAFIPIGNR